MFPGPVCSPVPVVAKRDAVHTIPRVAAFELFPARGLSDSPCSPCGLWGLWHQDGRGSMGSFGERFYVVFEALIMMMAKAMPVKSIANIVKEHDTRLWRVLNHYVHESRQESDFSAVTEVGVDETSSKRGHNYVSLFVDMKSSQVLSATEGKDASTLERFNADLEAHLGDPSNIREVCCDMSPAFISGVEKHFPEAHLTFDKFHVLKIINEAVDEVRRQEQQSRPELKRTRYIWLKRTQKISRRIRQQPWRLSRSRS
uniref:Transposase IS204/IS1001/IS1096/IS1165 DDE domain-containing protein n=1 Tax=uncultured Desulfobacterium sp. TaxID=201089 RepID=E1YAX6_9BACT|nr:hypothetical protein N47_H25420 [uncultured Desulfobacterium sp.]